MHIKLFESNSKTDQLKKIFIDFFIRNGAVTIADISKETDLSIPTVTKILGEMLADNIVLDCGKSEHSGTRKATLYNINPNMGYFIGVDIQRSLIAVALTNFAGELLKFKIYSDFKLTDNESSYIRLVQVIEQFLNEITIDRKHILNIGLNIPGRIDTTNGISYYYMHQKEEPITCSLEKKFNIPFQIDNDTRAMCYGEYMCGVGNGEKNVIFVNMSWGLGISIISDGKLYYGKSGFSGEWGHMHVFDNEIMCHCGKKGCLETEASGSAIYRKFLENYKSGHTTILKDKIEAGNEIVLNDILDAVKKDDILSIELIESAGRTLGKYIAGLLNIFNPELLILGGSVGAIGDYLAFPVKTGIMKYTLNYVNNDTDLRVATLGNKAGAIGACMLNRSKCLGLIKNNF
ncbi:MAG: ROK family transcriptional regulator [Bacteroidales bacterium]|nr:ROK family transcriptional regulator [Bacteroidales bacterium]